MQFNILSKLLSINILNSVVPLLTIIILKKAISTDDFSSFIITYSLVLFSISIIEFGFKNYFLTKSGVSALSSSELISSDRIRLTVITILCFFTFFLSLIIKNYFLLFFIPFVLKEYFFPIYKYQNLNKLKQYNFQLIIFQTIIITGLLITLQTSEIHYLYLSYFLSGLYLSILGYLFTLPRFKFISIADMYMIKKISPIGISNIVTSINQNLYKFFLGIISPTILVNFEIIVKLISIFKVPINFITEYFQIQSNELTKNKMIFYSLMIFTLSFLFFYSFKFILIDFFSVDEKYLYLYSLVLIPITINSLLHRVTNIINDKLKAQLVSISIGSLFLLAFTLYYHDFLTIYHVLVISILSEVIILIVTILLNYTNYERKIRLFNRW